ncbi:MAG: hypothetical protein C0501_13165 [Isosphaera sp.]|nr:hypothetical protein [Isosphaera sp.]
MTRVRFGLVALAASAALFATAAAQVPTPALPKADVDPKMPHFLVCAKACDDCARICDLCAAHCANIVADGKKEHLETLRTCQDCATVCSAAARVVAKEGPMSDLICAACADVCKRCGDACEKHAADPIMKRCADECRKCEKECRAMLAHAKATPATPK